MDGEGVDGSQGVGGDKEWNETRDRKLWSICKINEKSNKTRENKFSFVLKKLCMFSWLVKMHTIEKEDPLICYVQLDFPCTF